MPRTVRTGARLRALAMALWLFLPGQPWIAEGSDTPSSEAGETGGDGERQETEDSRPSIHQRQLAELSRPKGRGDGGGSARLIWKGKSEPVVEAGESGRWSLVFVAGSRGIAPGGAIFFYVPRYWSWSPPQIKDPSSPGFTRVESYRSDRKFALTTYEKLRMIRIGVTGTEMSAGEKVYIHYGAGPKRATVDSFAERESKFWFAVDGDGDGHPWLIQEPVTLRVRAGPPVKLQLGWPGTARPGDTVHLTVALLDKFGNAGIEGVDMEVMLGSEAPELGLPQTVRLSPDDLGSRSLALTIEEPGTYRFWGRTKGGLYAESNPLWVSREGPRLLWADLQGHSAWSDGTGTPEDYFAYARDVAGLDAVALTPHDHHGPPLPEVSVDRHPTAWDEVMQEVERFHQPGRFVTVPGFEWTSWTYGHRHVLFFDQPAELLSNVDPLYDTPSELWAALEGREAMTVAHHSAGGPVAIDWSIDPDPLLEPVTEVLSIHGSSEAEDLPHLIHRPQEDNFVRGLLDRGLRFGFIGSGDGHDGHPGLSHLSSRRGGGLAAIFSEELSRPGILEALRARRAYATNGSRILLRATLGGKPMGTAVCVSPEYMGEKGRGDPLTLRVEVSAEQIVERVEVIRDSEVTEVVPGEDRLDLSFEREISDAKAGGYLYLRVLERGGGLAISSPFFFD